MGNSWGNFALGCLLVILIAGCSRGEQPSVRLLTPASQSTHTTKPHRAKEDNSPESQALIDQEAAESELKPDPPAGATAECLDDTYSYAKKRDEACVEHRGIKKWLTPGSGK